MIKLDKPINIELQIRFKDKENWLSINIWVSIRKPKTTFNKIHQVIINASRSDDQQLLAWIKSLNDPLLRFAAAVIWENQHAIRDFLASNGTRRFYNAKTGYNLSCYNIALSEIQDNEPLFSIYIWEKSDSYKLESIDKLKDYLIQGNFNIKEQG